MVDFAIEESLGIAPANNPTVYPRRASSHRMSYDEPGFPHYILSPILALLIFLVDRDPCRLDIRSSMCGYTILLARPLEAPFRR